MKSKFNFNGPTYVTMNRERTLLKFVHSWVFAFTLLCTACEQNAKVGSEDALTGSVSFAISLVSGNDQSVAPRLDLLNPIVFQISDASGRLMDGVGMEFYMIDVTGRDTLKIEDLNNAWNDGVINLATDAGTNLADDETGGGTVGSRKRSTLPEDVVGTITLQSSTTDASGKAKVFIKGPAGYSRKIAVLARAKSKFANKNTIGYTTFQTSNFSEAAYIMLDTTHGGKESGGTDFDIYLSAVDKAGNPARAFEGKLKFKWKSESPESWTGRLSKVPAAEFECVFAGGQCLIPGGPFTLNGAGSHKVTIQDIAHSRDIEAKILVSVGKPAALVVATKVGGPEQEAMVVREIKQTTEETKTLAAAIVDAGGNYIDDADSATWTITVNEMGTSLPSKPAKTVNYRSTRSGKAELKISAPIMVGDQTIQVASEAIPVNIPSGAQTKWIVKTEHGNTETAGECFKVVVTAADSRGNPNTEVSGPKTLSIEIKEAESGPMVADQAHFDLQGRNLGPLFETSIQFFNGIATLPMKACFYDASDIPNARIEVSSAADASSPAFAGSQIVKVVTGLPYRLIVSGKSIASGLASDLCLAASLRDLSLSSACIVMTVDVGQQTFYPTVVDKGGNPLSHVNATWTVTGPLAAQLNGQSSSGSISATIAAIGSGTIQVATLDGGMSLSNTYEVLPGAPSSYTITSEHDGNEAATTPFKVKVAARDQLGNLSIHYSGSKVFNFILENASNSPSGSAPVTTFSETLTFVNGYATTTGTLLAKLASSQPSGPAQKPRIAGTTSGSTFRSSDLTISAGPPQTIGFRDAQSGGGSDLNVPFWFNVSTAKTIYIAGYDQYANYTGPVVANFTATGVVNGTLSVTSSSSLTTIVPVIAGQGTITATPVDNTVAPRTCGTITIKSTQAESFRITTTNSNVEPAGANFNIMVTARDRQYNTASEYEGSRTLNFIVQTSDSWAGESPILPTGDIACTFVQGVCTLSDGNGTPINYKLTDSRQTTILTVSDVSQEVPDGWTVTLTANRGPAVKLALADKLGGPSGGAVAYKSAINLTTDDTLPLFGAKVDQAGNYVTDATNATSWTGTAVTILPNLSSTSGRNVTLVPTLTGTGTVTASLTGMASVTSPTININPGVLAGLKILTQNGNSEVAAQSFTFSLVATDAKGNKLTNYNVVTGVAMSWVQDVSGPQTYGPGILCCDNNGNSATSLTIIQAPFVNGQYDHGGWGKLFDATSVTPKIHAALGSAGGFPAITADTSNYVTMNKGPAHHITFMASTADDGQFICGGPQYGYPFGGTYDPRQQNVPIVKNMVGDPLNDQNTWTRYSVGYGFPFDGAPIPCLDNTNSVQKTIYAHVHDLGENDLGLAVGNWSITLPGTAAGATGNAYSYVPHLTPARLALLNSDLLNATNSSSVTLKNRYATQDDFAAGSAPTTYVGPVILNFVSSNPATCSGISCYGAAPIVVEPGAPVSVTAFNTSLTPTPDLKFGTIVGLLDQFGNLTGRTSGFGVSPITSRSYPVTFSWVGGTPPSSKTGMPPIKASNGTFSFGGNASGINTGTASSGGWLNQCTGMAATQSSPSTAIPPTGSPAGTSPVTDDYCAPMGHWLGLAGTTTQIQVQVGSFNSVTENITVGPGEATQFVVIDAPSNSGVPILNPTINADSTFDGYYALWDFQNNFVSSYQGSPTATGAVWSLPAYLLNNSGGFHFIPGPVGTGAISVDAIPANVRNTGLPSGPSHSFTASTVNLGTFTVTEGVLNNFVFSTQHSRLEVAGVPFTITVTARDQRGNTKAAFTGSKYLYWSIANSNPNRETRSATIPANGFYNFTNGVLTDPVTITLYNSSDVPNICVGSGPSSSDPTGCTGSITVSNGPVDHYGVYVANASYTPRSDRTTLITAIVETRDVAGNVLASGGESGVQLTMVKSDGSSANGTLVGSTSGLDLTSGSVTLTDLAYDIAGSFRLRAKKPSGGTYDTPITASSLASTIITATPTLAVVKNFSVTFTSPFTAGTPSMITVIAKDNSGNTVTGIDTELSAQTYTWSGASVAPDNTSPDYGSSSLTFASGAAFPTIKLYKAETITSGNLTIQDNFTTPHSGVSTSNLVVQAGTLHNYRIAANTATATADSTGTFNLTINARDQWFNVRSGDGALALQPVLISGVSNTTSFSGTATSSLNLVPGTLSVSAVTYQVPHTISFSLGSASVSTFYSDQMTFTPTAKTISSYGLSMANSVNAGSALSVTASALDVAGNTISGIDSVLNAYTYTWSGAGTTVEGFGPTYGTMGTFSSGVATVSHTLRKAETLSASSLTVVDNYTSPRTGTNSSPLTVNNIAANHLVLGLPGTDTLAKNAGTGFDINVTARDQYGNTDIGYSSASLTFAWVNTTAAPGGQTAAVLSSGSRTFTNGIFSTSTVTSNAFVLYNSLDSNIQLSLVTPPLTTANLTGFTVAVSTALASLKIKDGPSDSDNNVTSQSATTDDAPITLYAHGYDAYGNWKGRWNVDWTGTSALNAWQCTSGKCYAPRSNSNTTNITPYGSGSGTLTATDATGHTINTSVSFTVTSGTPSKYSVSYSVSNASPIAAGTGFNVTVTAKDAHSNTATSYTGSHSLTFSWSSGALNSPAPTSQAPAKASNGSYTFTNGVASTTGTAFKAYHSGDSGIYVSVAGDLVIGNGPGLTITYSSAYQIWISSGTSITAGTAFGVTVGIVDQWDNFVTNIGTSGSPVNYSLSFTWSNTTVTDVGSVSPVKLASGNYGFVNGQYTTSSSAFTYYYAWTANPYLTVSCSGSPCTSLTVQSRNNLANPYTASAASLNFVRVSKTTTAHSTDSTNILRTGLGSLTTTTDNTTTLYANGYDQWGNLVGQVSSNWSATGVANCSLCFNGATNTATATSISFSPQTSTAANSTGTISVTTVAAPTPSDTTSTITVNPGALNNFLIAWTVSSPVTAGTGFDVTLTMRDAKNNTRWNFSSSQSLTISYTNFATSPAPTSQAAATLASGSRTFTNGVYSTSGSTFKIYGVTSNATMNITSPVSSTSPTLNVVAATAARIEVYPTIATQTAGTAFGATVNVVDTWSNTTTTGCAGTNTLALSCTGTNCDSPGSAGQTVLGFVQTGTPPYSQSSSGVYSVTGLKLHKAGSNTLNLNVAGCSLSTTTNVTVNAAIENVIFTDTTNTIPAVTTNPVSDVTCTAGSTITCPTVYAFAWDTWGNNISGTSYSCPSWTYINANSLSPYTSGTYNGTLSASTGHSTSVSSTYHILGSFKCTSGSITRTVTLNGGSTAVKVTKSTHTFTCGNWSCPSANTPTGSCTLTNSTSYGTLSSGNGTGCDSGGANCGGYLFSGNNAGNTLSGCTAGLSTGNNCTLTVTGTAGTASGSLAVAITPQYNHSGFVTMTSPASPAVQSGANAPNCTNIIGSSTSAWSCFSTNNPRLTITINNDNGVQNLTFNSSQPTIVTANGASIVSNTCASATISGGSASTCAVTIGGTTAGNTSTIRFTSTNGFFSVLNVTTSAAPTCP